MPSKLRDPQQALGNYLDEMLHQATLEPTVGIVVDKPARVLLPGELLAAETEIAQPGDSEIDAALAADSENEAPEETSSFPANETGQATEHALTEFPMQCLMFRVGDHLLSIPLIQLSGVVDWSNAITRLPESPDWMLGLMKHRDINLRIADSRLLLNIETDSLQAPEHLLVLDDGRWAITCDHLEQVVNLDYDDIQWKQGDVKRLALGTIRESLSTLLNPSGISAMLNSRDRANGGS